jgi:Ras-related protein Rab-8A
VGKSSILLRYAESEFNPEQLSTIGIDFRIRTIVAADGKRLKLQIWDTAGQERFRSITQAYYRGAMGLMIVYDVTKEKTFQAVKEWVSNVNQHADKSVICFLIGNKSDLESERKVSKEEGQRLGTLICLFFSLSLSLAYKRET